MTVLQFSETLKYKIARDQLIDQFVKFKILTDQRIINAFRKIPRHLFVDEAFNSLAYRDQPLPIGFDQTISHPSTVARMIELLQVGPQHRVLEIGTGSGYQTAILSELSGKVYSVERIESFVKKAKRTLAQLGFYSVRIEWGDGSQGWPDAAPFDRIVVSAGSPEIPESLCRQLNTNGRLIIPVGERKAQKITIVTRLGETFHVEEESNCEFVDLIGKNGWQTRC